MYLDNRFRTLFSLDAAFQQCIPLCGGRAAPASADCSVHQAEGGTGMQGEGGRQSAAFLMLCCEVSKKQYPLANSWKAASVEKAAATFCSSRDSLANGWHTSNAGLMSWAQDPALEPSICRLCSACSCQAASSSLMWLAGGPSANASIANLGSCERACSQSTDGLPFKSF